MARNTVVYWEQLRDFFMFDDSDSTGTSYYVRDGFFLVGVANNGEYAVTGAQVLKDGMDPGLQKLVIHLTDGILFEQEIGDGAENLSQVKIYKAYDWTEESQARQI